VLQYRLQFGKHCAETHLNPAVVGLFVAAVWAGCTGSAALAKRGTLLGQVTLDGKPVASGLIRFIALDPAGVNVVARSLTENQPGEGEGPTKANTASSFRFLRPPNAVFPTMTFRDSSSKRRPKPFRPVIIAIRRWFSTTIRRIHGPSTPR